jgi:putative DNA primase/helicase
MNAAKTDPTKPPTTLGIDPRRIPEVLREIPQWVAWKWEWRGDKWTKPLCNASTGAPASVDDPASWSTVKQAYQTYRQNKDKYDGIGIVLTENLGLVAIDLDDCVTMTGETKVEIAPWASEIMERFPTYWEISPSGTGLRGIGRGTLTRPGRRRGKIEVYDRLRYVTLTGQSDTTSNNPVVDIQVNLDRWHREVWPDPPPPRASAPAGEGTGNNLSDDELLDRARSSSNGERFATLFDGDWKTILDENGKQKYASQSDADLALVSMLLFWTNGDTGRVDLLFRQSRLVRDKWTERDDYRERTIAMALQGFEGGFGAGATPEDPPEGTWRGADEPTDEVFNVNVDDPYMTAEAEAKRLGTLLTFPQTDSGNAERVALLYGDIIRWVPEGQDRGEWLVWNGQRWEPGSLDRVRELTLQTIRLTLSTAVMAMTTDLEARKRMIAFLLKSEGAGDVNDAVRALRFIPGRPLEAPRSAFDQNPFLLNCQNVTVDLRTGKGYAHRRDDMITRITPFPYEPTAPCVRWEQTLAQILRESPDVVAYLQRAFGYSLTDSVEEQVFFLLLGGGNNGKSTVVDTVMGAIGADYTLKVPSETLLAIAKHQEQRDACAHCDAKPTDRCGERDRGRALPRRSPDQEPHRHEAREWPSVVRRAHRMGEHDQTMVRCQRPAELQGRGRRHLPAAPGDSVQSAVHR